MEIARALVAEARVLILDEPTAVLSPSGADKLFERIRMLKARGVTVILILHKIREVLAIADTVTVLRGGKLMAATPVAADQTPLQIAEVLSVRPAARRSIPADAKAIIGAEGGRAVVAKHVFVRPPRRCSRCGMWQRAAMRRDRG